MRPFRLSRSPSKMCSYQSRAAAGSADRRCRWWKPSHSVSSTTSIFVPHGSSTKASLKRPSISRMGSRILTPAASNDAILAARSVNEKPMWSTPLPTLGPVGSRSKKMMRVSPAAQALCRP